MDWRAGTGNGYRIRPSQQVPCLTFNRHLSLPVLVIEGCSSGEGVRLDMDRTRRCERIASSPVVQIASLPVQIDHDWASASKRHRYNCSAGMVRTHLNQNYASRVPQIHQALRQTQDMSDSSRRRRLNDAAEQGKFQKQHQRHPQQQSRQRQHQ